MPQQRRSDTAREFERLFGTAPVSLARAVDAGLSRGRLRGALADGSLVRRRHGVLALARAGGAPDAPDRPATDYAESLRTDHLDALRTVLVVLGPTAMAAYDSAALVHRTLRPRSGPPPLLQVIVPGEADYTCDGLRVRGSGVPVGQRVVVDGIPTTSIARTALDLARGRPLAEALIPVDSGMRALIAQGTGVTGNGLRGAVRDDGLREWARMELTQALRRMYAWPGTVAARTAVAAGDPAAESAPESRSRGWILESSLPPVEAGVPIAVRSGHVYWADLYWRGHGVVGEVDGWAKYGTELAAVGAALRAERGRRDALEDEGLRVVRWTSTDPRPVVLARLGRVLPTLSPPA